MSSMSNPIRVRSLLPAGFPRPRLTIVPKVASRAPRVPFVILVVLVLGCGLIGLLLVNTALQRGAYEVSDLRSRSAALAAQEQSLQMSVAELRQPHRVARAALALGMVRSDSPAFLDLATGAVTGSAQPADKADKPRIGLHPGRLTRPGPQKPTPLLAGAGASQTTRFVHVPKAAANGPDRDTSATSGNTHAAQATNNSNNTR
jgi:hypothetical protein